MPRFFLDIPGSHTEGEVSDIDLPDPAAAREHAVRTARELLIESRKEKWDIRDWRVVVTDEHDRLIADVRVLGQAVGNGDDG